MARAPFLVVFKAPRADSHGPGLRPQLCPGESRAGPRGEGPGAPIRPYWARPGHGALSPVSFSLRGPGVGVGMGWWWLQPRPAAQLRAWPSRGASSPSLILPPPLQPPARGPAGPAPSAQAAGPGALFPPPPAAPRGQAGPAAWGARGPLASPRRSRLAPVSSGLATSGMC